MTWGKRSGLWGFVGVVAAIACSRSGDEGGPTEEVPVEVSCGDAMCSERETCDKSGKEPRCECRAAFTGPDCESCAVGYEEKENSCEALVIDCDDSPCGPRGACVSETGQADSCECAANHTGPTCAQCETGAQDNDGDDTCQMGCDHPDLALDCDLFLVCEDLSGTAVCVCPVGSSGENCELCDEGYARRGDGLCYKTCGHSEFECAEQQYCFDDGRKQSAACLCPLGMEGDDCSACSEDFEKVGDACVLSDPPDFDLLTFIEHQGRKVLAGIDSESGELVLLQAASDGEGLVHDAESGSLFVADSRGVGTLDWNSGKFELLAAAQIGHGKPLAYDTQRKRLVTFRSDDYQLLGVNTETGSIEELGITGVSWLWDASYDPQTDMIYGLRSQGTTPTVHAIDPTNGMATSLGSLSGLNPLGSESWGGIAAVSSGDLMVLAREEQTVEDVQERTCREAAHRLGFDGYEEAPHLLVPDSETENVVLSSAHDGKELISLRVGSDAENTVVELNLTNPEAFLCIFSYSEGFTLKAENSAKWAGGIAYTYEATVNVDVASAASVGSPIMVLGGQNADLSAVNGVDQVIRQLSAQEGVDRVLPELSDFSGQARRTGPYVLRSFELPSLSEASSVDIEAKIVGALTAY